MGFIIFSFVCFLASVEGVFATITCRNEWNQPTDWYIIYKFPKVRRESFFSTLGRGESYAYLQVYNEYAATWVLSNKEVSSTNSILGNTLQAFYDNKKILTYLLYNDEPASEGARLRYETTGHTKGVVVFDQYTGFWLIHSVPKFPSENAYDYPKSGLEYGQSALCVSFRTEELNEIGKQLLFNHPNIYSKGFQDATFSSLDEDVKSLFSEKPQFVKKLHAARVTTLQSVGNMAFTSFAKDDEFGADLYDGLVAPKLKASLFVESWRRNPGTPLPPSCQGQYVVENVMDINITVIENSRLKHIAFSSWHDHSKWAVTIDPVQCWVCIGDINRMKSQWKRGGGTVCLNFPAVHTAFISLIAATDKCIYWPLNFGRF